MSVEMVEEAVVSAGLSETRTLARVRLPCPMCEAASGRPDRKRNLSVETSNGWWRCHRCGERGTLPGWGDAVLEELGGTWEARPNLGLARVAEMQLPEGYAPLWKPSVKRSLGAQAAVAYARTRIREDLWETLQVGATLTGQRPEVGRIVVPVLDMEDRCVGWVGRSWGKSTLPYYNAKGMERAKGVLWNPKALLAETEVPLIVCEGVFDAAHLWPDGVAVMGKPSPAQLQALALCARPVVWCLDGDTCDEQGVGETDTLLLWLRAERGQDGKRTGAVRLPPTLDPDDLPAEEVRRLAVASLEES